MNDAIYYGGRDQFYLWAHLPNAGTTTTIMACHNPIYVSKQKKKH